MLSFYIEGLFRIPLLCLIAMGREEYDITFVGPDGYIEIVSDTHEDCMEIVNDLVGASNGYHQVKVDPPQE